MKGAKFQIKNEDNIYVKLLINNKINRINTYA